MGNRSGFNQILLYMDEKIRQALSGVPDKEAVQEIRIRQGRPLVIGKFGREYFVCENGALSQSPAAGLKINRIQLENTFKAICEYSIHSFQREVAQGYITLNGGHRVGLCGTAVTKDSHTETVKYISGLNFRIAHQVYGCADAVMTPAYRQNPESMLIAGAPSSGKTTILRDLCRQLGQTRKLSIVDERGEIAAVYQGEAQNDVGVHTDILDSYVKEDGILTAIRVLSPEIVALDEIGSLSDCTAIEHTMHAGVKIIATVHAGSLEEVYARRHIRSLIRQGVFKSILLLGTGSQLGKIIDRIEVKNHAERRGYAFDHSDHIGAGRYFFQKADGTDSAFGTDTAYAGGNLHPDTVSGFHRF